MTEKIEPPAARPRIGVHLSTAGGVFRAAERAHEIGANTFQIFSSSPRMWRQPKIAADHCAQMRELRERFDVSPLVIHASYLINVAAQSDTVWKNSIAALRGEIGARAGARRGVPGAASRVVARDDARGGPAARGGGDRAGDGRAGVAGV